MKRELVTLLERYFGLRIDPIDEGREDFKIVENAAILAVAEAKGTTKGVKREHINQGDSHRERQGLANDVPGLLIINNEMEISSVEGRLRAKVAPEQIKHARNMNVLIVRTIDLLFVMRDLEDDSERREKLMKLLQLRRRMAIFGQRRLQVG